MFPSPIYIRYYYGALFISIFACLVLPDDIGCLSDHFHCHGMKLAEAGLTLTIDMSGMTIAEMGYMFTRY